MKINYFIFSLIFCISSLLMLLYKGYFNVTHFNVENRSDIEDFLNTRFSSRISFFYLDTELVAKEVRTNFGEIEDVVISKNFDLSVNTIVKERTPFAYNKESDMYISENGIAYNSKKDFSNVALVEFSEIVTPGEKVLDEKEVTFIKSIEGYPNIKISTEGYNNIVISSDLYPRIVVDRNNTDLRNMINPVAQVLERVDNNEVSPSQILILNSKLVLKN